VRSGANRHMIVIGKGCCFLIALEPRVLRAGLFGRGEDSHWARDGIIANMLRNAMPAGTLHADEDWEGPLCCSFGNLSQSAERTQG
jgi:hypothetical protein